MVMVVMISVASEAALVASRATFTFIDRLVVLILPDSVSESMDLSTGRGQVCLKLHLSFSQPTKLVSTRNVLSEQL